MLFSEKEERGRRFTLALRAGMPVLILMFLVFSTTIYKEEQLQIGLSEGILLSATTFITIYFLYFFMNMSVHETLIDATTKTFNTKTFIKKLSDYHPEAIACLSIENLSSLHEHYSTKQLDEALYLVSKQLNRLFSKHGLKTVLIGRNRGSEFLIALHSNPQKIEAILQEMLTQYSCVANIDLEYKFAIITDTDKDFDKIIIQLRDIINSQDEKTIEKNSSTGVSKNAKELSEIEQNIIRALEDKKFLLSFRPLLNVRSNSHDTYEISVKLDGGNHQTILPRIYLPIVNRLGLGRGYDWALVTHITALLPLVDEGVSFTFNLSPFSLRDPSFQEKFFDHINTQKIDPSRLVIQLYERKTHHDLSGYLRTLKKFRTEGLRICIDNFGSSNASMEYIKHFKFDMVQFDRDYVTKLEDKTTYAMLHSLIKMSKDLEVETVAKWVDNPEQAKKLKLLGITYIQGFGVGNVLDEATLIEHYNAV